MITGKDRLTFSAEYNELLGMPATESWRFRYVNLIKRVRLKCVMVKRGVRTLTICEARDRPVSVGPALIEQMITGKRFHFRADFQGLLRTLAVGELECRSSACAHTHVKSVIALRTKKQPHRTGVTETRSHQSDGRVNLPAGTKMIILENLPLLTGRIGPARSFGFE